MAKKKEENVQAVENEEMKVKFQEKLKELLVLGKKKKNILMNSQRRFRTKRKKTF